MASTRAYALSQIMQIEDQIKKVSNSPRYRKVQQYTKDLQDSPGISLIEVEDPENMGHVEKIRKNSPQAQEYLKTYLLLKQEYDVLFKELHQRRAKYRKSLFKQTPAQRIKTQ